MAWSDEADDFGIDELTGKPSSHEQEPADATEATRTTQGAPHVDGDVAAEGRSIALGGSAYNSVFITGDVGNVTLAPDNSDKLDQIIGQIAELQAGQGVADDQHAELRSQINVAFRLSQEGHFSAAKSIAERLRATAPPSAPVDLRHRLTNVLGVSQMRLGKTGEAIDALESSLDDEEMDPTTLIHAASAYLMDGDPQRAKDLAARALLGQQRADAVAVQLQATYELEGFDSVQDLLARNRWAQDDRRVRIAHSVVLSREGQFKAAEDTLGEPPKQIDGADDVEHLSVLAGAIVNQAQGDLAATRALPWDFPEAAERRLKQAEALFTQLVNYLESQPESNLDLARALGHRAATRTIAGNQDGARRDFDRALGLGLATDDILLNRARLHISDSEFERAIGVLEPLTRNQNPDALVLVGLARLNLGDPTGAVKALVSALKCAGGPSEAEPLLLHAYVELADWDKADELAKRISSSPAGERAVDRTTALGQYHYMRGDRDRATRLLRQAADSGDDLARLSLAIALRNAELWSDAADEYARVAGIDADPDVARSYAFCLYQAGRLPEALEYAESVRLANGPYPGLTELEASLRAVASDSEEVVRLCVDLRRLEPSSAKHEVAHAIACAGVGDFETASEVAAKVDPQAVGDPALLVRLAHLLSALGTGDPLAIAWEALRRSPNDADAIAAFLWFFVQRERDGNITEPSEVRSDSAVVLEQADGRTFQVTILDRDDLRENEYRPTSAVGGLLLGRVVGQEVPWRKGFGGTETVKVVAIQSKYVPAFQSADPNRSPQEAPVVERFTGDPQDLVQKLASQAKARDELISDLIAQYAGGQPLPLYGIATAIGESLSVAKERVRDAPDGHLRAFLGAPAYLASESGAIETTMEELGRRATRGQSRVAIDECGLLTLAELGALPLLEHRFQEVIVPQSVVASLDQQVLSVTGRLQPETTPESLAAVERARAWVRQNGYVVPVYGRLRPPSELQRKADAVFGVSVVDVFLAAEQHGVAMYSDDLATALVASKERGLQTTNTIHLITELGIRERIAPIDRAQLLARLQQLRYAFVSINHADLWTVFEQEGMSSTLDVLFSTLSGPDTSSRSAFFVGLTFLRHVILQSNRPLAERIRVARALLDRLAQGREKGHVTTEVARAFQRFPSSRVLDVMFLVNLVKDWVAEPNAEFAGTSDDTTRNTVGHDDLEPE